MGRLKKLVRYAALPRRSSILRLDELNAPERRLWDSFAQGRTVGLRDDPAWTEEAAVTAPRPLM